MTYPARRIAATLRARIISGELADGDLLPSLPTIARAEDVVEATARKAIRQLEDEGMVYTRGGRQAVVSRAQRVPCPWWATGVLRTPEGGDVWAQTVEGEIILRRITDT